MTSTNSRLIYSTDHGALCPECVRKKNECVCRQRQRSFVPQTNDKVSLRYETSGRKGKGLTVIAGLPLSRAQLEDAAKKLKNRLGTGGTVKDYVIELQGDHRKTVLGQLRALGIFPDQK